MSLLQKTSRAILRERPLTHSIAVHGLHKSATMFLFRFFETVAADRGVEFFSENLPDRSDPSVTKQPYCISPIRTFDFEQDIKQPIHRIFLVRDPRDILVSEYFSFGWIHSDEKDGALDQRRKEIQAMTVDDYVLNQTHFSAWPLEQKFPPLLALDENEPLYTMLRYEDMVLRFSEWVRPAIAPFNFRFEQLAAKKYVRKFESQFTIRPESMTHRRKITPGDHKEKLLPKTIEKLNERFHAVLARFGYSER